MRKPVKLINSNRIRTRRTVSVDGNFIFQDGNNFILQDATNKIFQ